MLGLLFLLVLPAIAVWAYVFRDLVRGVDPRSPLPSRAERRRAELLAAIAAAGVSFAEFARSISEAFRQVRVAMADAAPAMRRFGRALEEFDRERRAKCSE